MPKDAIKLIFDAEAAAQSAIDEALLRIKTAIEQAESDGRASVEEAERSAAADNQNLTREVDARAMAYSGDLLSHTNNKCAAIRARAEARMEKAAEAITERIVSEFCP